MTDSDDLGMPTVVSIFAGCGGSSLGYKWAGYRELLAIDFDAHAEECFRLNFPEVPFWRRDIRGIQAKEILDACGLAEGELDVLDGSPPCQGFSMAGRRIVRDRRNDLFKEYCRLLEGLKPKVFVMENVSGMASGRMKGIFIKAYTALGAAGYKVHCRLLNATNYGVPQDRRRLFFIGFRKDLIGGFEDWTCVFPSPIGHIITVEEALIGIDNTYQEVIIPSGQAAVYAPMIRPWQDGGDYHPRGSLFNLKRLHPQRPSRTITKTFRQGVAGLLHPSENRYITIAEAKRLSSFPDSFRFVGTFAQQWARIGNSVMPKQMEAIANAIKVRLKLIAEKTGGANNG